MYVYMLLCEDDSFYIGIAKDMKKRWQEHRLRLPAAAKYTKSHPVKAPAALWEVVCDDAKTTASVAAKAEYALKQLRHTEKAKVAADQTEDRVLKELFAQKNGGKNAMLTVCLKRIDLTSTDVFDP